MELSEIVSGQPDLNHAIDTVWVALCAALIFFMEGGFALLEAGFVRSKNAMSIIAKVIIDIIFGGMAFFIVGFGIAYGASNGWFAFDLGISGNDLGLGLNISNKLFWFIQLGFAIAAISIVSGALAERMKLVSYTIYVVAFCAIIYPLVANWVWNPNGWLAARGFNDFAGSGAVHAMGGFAALAAAIVLGPRIGKYNRDRSANTIPGHNLPLAAIGAFILWFGWFGFNPGSTLGAVGNWELIGTVVTNTFLASAAGGISTMIYTYYSYGKIDITMVINGVLAGLVGITAGCNVVEAHSAIIIGAIAGVLVDVAVIFIDKLQIDDPVGAVAVHGVNGLFGTLAVGLFAAEGGLLFGGGSALFVTQLIGVITIASFSFVVTYILFKIIDKTIGIRISREEEIAGIDAASFGVESYSTHE
ncbi:ammonium transporter [Flavobacteriaceae bacterium]|uniref:ammonium transporter n=1 Tax=Candidatus Arcticimaribacter forsetii TaxID=2820661 RepID=UPI002076E3A2|nr:ammonium transporter [Candidatus Arcticimaribacter forsetii]MDA8639641.1 ammonium transporter [Flavobacteriaceae bacterium]MDA8698684.1 ammonium transporter [Flavobacteriaceae bacterium]MDB2329616.1 ammonium transporter [Flavobacteriaceae bacterium]MDB2346032.1 ammonium transporter [Flavobacteriaceae bacterium]MDB2456686.1 ammonium transporter [Flavobacteriaceae bacterium]